MPYDLITELVLPKHLVTYDTNMMRDARFYMNDDVAVLLENPATLNDSFLHKLGEVRKLVVEVVEVTTRVIWRVHIDHVDALGLQCLE
jgi:hypothetical protein